MKAWLIYKISEDFSRFFGRISEDFLEEFQRIFFFELMSFLTSSLLVQMICGVWEVMFPMKFPDVKGSFFVLVGFWVV